MTNIIEAVHVNKNFNGRSILSDVSFSIKEGSINGLLGPNGAGKTTMIRLLNGVINPNSGTMKVMGYDPKSEGDEIRKRAGIVTESAALYHDMSAWDNLVFFSKIYNAYDPKRISYLLDQFGMNDKKDQLIGTFSTGMKKRITLAKALLHKPSLLFLDEPTNGLDPEGINDVIHYLSRVNAEEKVTIVICSHVLHQLETICDSFLFLKNGRIIEEGTRSELEDKYLKEIKLLVETGLKPENRQTYMGHVYERKEADQLEFTLGSKEDITPLLSGILNESWVHSCEITNRSLEALYFKIRGEDHE
ncbi:ABC transporter ATP-binding protein [Neobacillus ginsengisoli]|uniref:ABC-2 type transport system ATP-binding protein n=1 Tax=Neobacillus ginsengisoli TaxID=904295 RepID=A0ABT9XTS0_9BACI|nr:ABC transporter ATP-binding protein [Neobacillus ginsengisoli]MDQ0198327.1 ABC-2 type transport system ATP-binding protein [Neobacillus ginsengisoli]